jgi:selenocysteine-specific elongation factor
VHVVGTAGHVDHGKSSLVRALTGTDPDRWLEERLRGMTLDLGFAHLRFPDGVEAGIVDVPGHERFLHNMLAGAAGMEVLLLAIAANEGPRPQTFEHLQILQYLNVRATIVAVTKIDLLEPGDRAFALESIADALRGTLAEGARLLPVSTVTGEGLDDLKAALHEALRGLPPRAVDAPVYLPVDRAFALPGFGTVVTGTLMQGRVATGARLRVSPPGSDVRVRGLQVFGEARESADGGTRLALNLPGVDVAEVARGAVVASVEIEASDAFAVEFTALPAALAMLRRRMPVRAYIGSAELLGRLVFARTPVEARPVAATLLLRAPVVAPVGSTFVVRRLSPKDILGGGTLGSPAVTAEGGAAGEGSPETQRVAAALAEAGIAGATAERIAAKANVRADLAAGALEALAAEGRALRVARPDGFVDAAAADALLARVEAALLASESEKPWLMGLTLIGLSRALSQSETSLARLLFAFAEDGRLAHRHGYFSTPGFAPRLTKEQRAFFDARLVVDPAAPNVPLPFDAIVADIGTARSEGLSQALDMLLAGGALVRVGDALYRRSQMTRIRADLENALKLRGTLTMAEFRDLIGTSRKYAVPLLEWFDAAGVTLRNGDVRVLRQTAKV